MKEEVLKSFSEYLEKQDVLCKLTENVKLHEYGYSEIHTIVAIKELNEPNVTAISNRLKMTKGAISKIIKKLLNNGTYRKRGKIIFLAFRKTHIVGTTG